MQEDSCDEIEEVDVASGLSQPAKTQTTLAADSKQKPLLNEATTQLTITSTSVAQGKSSGGSKRWICKHCKQVFTSSYTRIHAHFFGPEPGKRCDIQRCPIMLKDRKQMEKLRKRVQEAEKAGVSSSLKSSTISKRFSQVPMMKSVGDAFGIMERDAVDLKVIRGLTANGITFNVLRNPQFNEMVATINKGPKGYKAPSFEKARTTLLDKCKRSVEKDLIPIKNTWYTQGVSIVTDGWTNVKNRPLINVIATNNRGAMFMYVEDFSGIEKTGAAIAEFLLKAVEEIGASNVLQIVTDSAANCKLAGKEIEKVHKHIFWTPCVVHTLNLIFKDFA